MDSPETDTAVSLTPLSKAPWCHWQRWFKWPCGYNYDYSLKSLGPQKQPPWRLLFKASRKNKTSSWTNPFSQNYISYSLTSGSQKFSNFRFEYHCEMKDIFKNSLACQSVAQMGKWGGGGGRSQKSRKTVHLMTVKTVKNFKYILLRLKRSGFLF